MSTKYGEITDQKVKYMIDMYFKFQSPTGTEYEFDFNEWTSYITFNWKYQTVHVDSDYKTLTIGVYGDDGGPSILIGLWDIEELMWIMHEFDTEWQHIYNRTGTGYDLWFFPDGKFVSYEESKH